MNNFYTENLADILACSTERRKVRKILEAWEDYGLPDDFWNEGVKLAFNKNSGYVFLVNEDYACAMLNGERLESYYSTPHDGIEGFFEELLEQWPHMNKVDRDYFRDIANSLGRQDEIPADIEEEQ